MTIAQEEIFGPVLVVIPYDDEDDAIRIANDSAYGLAGNVMSGSLERVPGGRPPAARRLHRPQRHRRLRRRHAVRRLQGQRRRTPERLAGFDQYTEIKSVAYPANSRQLKEFNCGAAVRRPRGLRVLRRRRVRATCGTPTRSWPGCGARSRSSGSTCRRCPAKRASPSSSCTATRTPSRCCATTRPFRRPVVIAAFGDVLGERVMLGMDEPVHGRLPRWCRRRSPRRRWRVGRTSWSGAWATN